MFKKFTELLQQAINYVTSQGAKPTDFNPGSVFRTVLEAGSALVEECYTLIAMLLNKFWIRTATGTWLDWRAADFGKTRKQGDYAKGVITVGRNAPAPFGIMIPKGTTFEADGWKYLTLDDATMGAGSQTVDVAAKSVEIGAAGNKPVDTLLKQVGQAVSGVEWAKIKTMKDGGNVETDDEFRDRLLEWLRHPGTSGNNADYKQWAMDIDGVTGARVLPCWNGPGTVKVVILGPDKKPPSVELVAHVQDVIAPADEMSETRKAPIGATVTILGAEPVVLNVDATVVLDSDHPTAIATIHDTFAATFANYLANMALKADTVRYARVGSLLVDQTGVLDYVDYTVNSGKQNIPISKTQVAVVGTVTLHVK